MATRKFRITVNGRTYEVEAEEITKPAGGEVPAEPVPAPARPAPAEAAPPVAERAPAGVTVVTAPLPGVVLDVKVTEGAAVAAGQIVIILEAMKMENEITAPVSGRIASLTVNKGTAVNGGDPLLTIAP